MKRLSQYTFLALILVIAAPHKSMCASSTEIAWLTNLQDAEARAAVERVPMMIDFYADWCGWCRVLDKRTYSDPTVRELAARVVPVKVNSDFNPSVARQYGVTGLPTIVFLDRHGNELSRVVGYRDASGFAAVLREVVAPHESLEALEAAARATPEDETISYRLADAYLAAARYEDAERVLRPLATSRTQSAVTADAGLDLAHALYFKGDYAAAAQAYQNFLKSYTHHERHLEARLYLAHVLRATFQTKSALKLYTQVRKESPPHAWQAHEAKRALAELKAEGKKS
jgi:thioredoxin-like negative regulator of GroEL